MAQSLLDILKADSGTSNRMLQSERQEGQSLLERLKAYDAPQMRTSIQNTAVKTQQRSSTTPKTYKSPYVTYMFETPQTSANSYTPGQAIQGKTPAAGQRTTAQSIAAMTDAQSAGAMPGIGPLCAPPVWRM